MSGLGLATLLLMAHLATPPGGQNIDGLGPSTPKKATEGFVDLDCRCPHIKLCNVGRLSPKSDNRAVHSLDEWVWAPVGHVRELMRGIHNSRSRKDPGGPQRRVMSYTVASNFVHPDGGSPRGPSRQGSSSRGRCWHAFLTNIFPLKIEGAQTKTCMQISVRARALQTRRGKPKLRMATV